MAHHEEQPTAIESVLELLSEHGLGAMAQAIVTQAQPGDVVISMGAGSIGNVPAQVVELLGRGA